MMYNFPFYPHFPTRSYRSYPRDVNKNVNSLLNLQSQNLTEASSLPKNRYKSHRNFDIKRANFPPKTSRQNTVELRTSNCNKDSLDYKAYNKNKVETDARTRNDKNVQNIFSSFFSNKDGEQFLEILGIKLYSDDILLLSLIFFLYKEGVQDEYLFIALIMLLLS